MTFFTFGLWMFDFYSDIKVLTVTLFKKEYVGVLGGDNFVDLRNIFFALLIGFMVAPIIAEVSFFVSSTAQIR